MFLWDTMYLYSDYIQFRPSLLTFKKGVKGRRGRDRGRKGRRAIHLILKLKTSNTPNLVASST